MPLGLFLHQLLFQISSHPAQPVPCPSGQTLHPILGPLLSPTMDHTMRVWASRMMVGRALRIMLCVESLTRQVGRSPGLCARWNPQECGLSSSGTYSGKPGHPECARMVACSFLYAGPIQLALAVCPAQEGRSALWP